MRTALTSGWRGIRYDDYANFQKALASGEKENVKLLALITGRELSVIEALPYDVYCELILLLQALITTPPLPDKVRTGFLIDGIWHEIKIVLTGQYMAIDRLGGFLRDGKLDQWTVNKHYLSMTLVRADGIQNGDRTDWLNARLGACSVQDMTDALFFLERRLSPSQRLTHSLVKAELERVDLVSIYRATVPRGTGLMYLNWVLNLARLWVVQYVIRRYTIGTGSLTTK